MTDWKCKEEWKCDEDLDESLPMTIDDIELLQLEGLEEGILESYDTELLLDDVDLPWETSGFGKRVLAPSVGSPSQPSGREKWKAVKIGEYGIDRVGDITGNRAAKRTRRKVKVETIQSEPPSTSETPPPAPPEQPVLVQSTLEVSFCRRVKVRVTPKQALAAEMKRRNMQIPSAEEVSQGNNYVPIQFTTQERGH